MKYLVFHHYDLDGDMMGINCRDDLIGVIEATPEEAKKYAEKYDKPGINTECAYDGIFCGSIYLVPLLSVKSLSLDGDPIADVREHCKPEYDYNDEEDDIYWLED